MWQPVSGAIPLRRCGTLMLGGVLLNVVGNTLTPLLNGLLFLDMIGTALVGLTLGPWWGASCGLLTNVTLAQVAGKEQYFNYIIVNVCGGILWGYVGRLLLPIFAPANSRRRAMMMIVVLGLLCGLLCSVTAEYTRLRFHWHLDAAMVANLPQRHATDKIVRFAIDSGYVWPGAGTWRLLPLDFISIVPDKIVSTALAAYMLFYFLPRLRRRVTALPFADSIWRTKFAAVLFLILYSYPLFRICTRGYVYVSGNTGVAGENIEPAQIVLWLVPALMAVAHLTIPSRRSSSEAVTIVDNNDSLEMKDIYRDVLALVGLMYTFLLTTRGRFANSAVADLIKDGIGIASFLAFFALIPNLALSYLMSPPPDPKVASKDEDNSDLE